MSGAHDYKFDLSIFEETQHADGGYDGPVRMNGMTLLGHRVTVSPLCVLAVIEGELYRYLVRVEPTKATVWVRRGKPGLAKLCSTIRPRNQQELLKAIDTIAADHEPVHNALEVSRV